MNYLLSILIVAVLASQTLIWHSLGTIRDAIQQTNAIVLATCGSDDRPCQVAARRGQVELGERGVLHCSFSTGFVVRMVAGAAARERDAENCRNEGSKHGTAGRDGESTAEPPASSARAGD